MQARHSFKALVNLDPRARATVCVCLEDHSCYRRCQTTQKTRADQKPGEGRQSGAGKGLVQRREAIGDGEEEKRRRRRDKHSDGEQVRGSEGGGAER